MTQAQGVNGMLIANGSGAAQLILVTFTSQDQHSLWFLIPKRTHHLHVTVTVSCVCDSHACHMHAFMIAAIAVQKSAKLETSLHDNEVSNSHGV